MGEPLESKSNEQENRIPLYDLCTFNIMFDNLCHDGYNRQLKTTTVCPEQPPSLFVSLGLMISIPHHEPPTHGFSCVNRSINQGLQYLAVWKIKPRANIE